MTCPCLVSHWETIWRRGLLFFMIPACSHWDAGAKLTPSGKEERVLPEVRGQGLQWSPRPLIQVIQGVWDCREKGPTHQKTPGAETWEEKGDEKEISDTPWSILRLSGKVSYLKSPAVAAWVDDMPLTCRGHPVCVGLWTEVRVGPPIPSNYTAAYSVWWCLSAVAAASTKRLHTGYLNPSSPGPTHLWNEP